mmetsp:Transcript_1408/g.1891  ORF Transcript_1408/g.1891 Transcript_1408/m.1891 type:complete len:892 (+) Transcript_1408:161-2836(+)
MSLVNPCLEDRKQFLACVAAILASSYDSFEATKQKQRDEKASSTENRHIQRYRQRKHEVASNLLLQTAKHLGLDPYEAERWLPLLEIILNPSDSSDDARGLQKDEQSQDEQFALLQDHFGLLKSQVESMTPGSGYLCLCLVLFEQLLSSEGYDARVRVVFKRLGATLLVHNNHTEDSSDYTATYREKSQKDSYAKRIAWATHKFESLEKAMAHRILLLAQHQSSSPENNDQSSSSASENAIQKRHIVRGMQIGAAGVVAGTLLVVTGGMAAPGIAAGLGALGITTTTVMGINLLALATSTAAITLFGAAGGGLAMYKMNRRTEGLKEFSIHKAGSTDTMPTLSRTILVSGWLRDGFDFQRPWGLELIGLDEEKNKDDRLELLQRFYAVHNPDKVQYAKEILERYEDGTNHWKELWELLKERYGVDPTNLYPIAKQEIAAANLTEAEVDLLDQIIVQIGKAHEDESGGKQKEKKKFWNFRGARKEEQTRKMNTSSNETLENVETESISSKTLNASSIERNKVTENASKELSSDSNNLTRQKNEDNDFEHTITLGSSVDKSEKTILEQSSPSVPRHCLPVWDYRATYGDDEVYSIRWESQLLLELCRDNLLNEFMSVAGKEALKHTVASTLLAATALPSAVFSAMNSIDGVWTLVTERSDAAGKALAHILCSKGVGRRPVTLVGYSFGARIIFSCLQELACFQEKWELQQKEHSSSSSSHLNENSKIQDSADSCNQKYEKLKLDFDCEPASVVEDVILMGMPKYLGGPSWKVCRQMVAGRFVNAFSRNDKILLYMFKYKRLLSGGILNRSVCGTTAVDKVPGVENIDVSDLIEKHTDYCLVVREILQRLDLGQSLGCGSTTVNKIEKERKAEPGVQEEEKAMDALAPKKNGEN